MCGFTTGRYPGPGRGRYKAARLMTVFLVTLCFAFAVRLAPHLSPRRPMNKCMPETQHLPADKTIFVVTFVLLYWKFAGSFERTLQIHGNPIYRGQEHGPRSPVTPSALSTAIKPTGLFQLRTPSGGTDDKGAPSQ